MAQPLNLCTLAMAGALGLEPRPSVLETDMLAVDTMPPNSQSATGTQLSANTEEGRPQPSTSNMFTYPVARFLNVFKKSIAYS